VNQWRNLSISPKAFGSVDAVAFLPFIVLLLRWNVAVIYACILTTIVFAVMARYRYTPTVVARRFLRLMIGSRRVVVQKRIYRRRVRCGLDR
jgi:hypothetical protein